MVTIGDGAGGGEVFLDQWTTFHSVALDPSWAIMEPSWTAPQEDYAMGRPPTVVLGVVDRIAEDIHNGTYRPGQWLPATRTLSETLGVSRATVIRALEILADRGKVVIHGGKGARVATRYVILTRANYEPTVDEETWRGLPPAILRAGETPYTDIIGNAEVPAPPRAAEKLGIPSGAVVFERARLQGAIQDDFRLPIQWATSWYPPSTVDTVPEIRDMPEVDPPPVRRRMLDAGRQIHAETVAIARFAIERERDLLGLPDPAVVIVAWRVWKDEHGATVEAIRIVDDARRVKISY